jgi:hypothetical protein
VSKAGHQGAGGAELEYVVGDFGNHGDGFGCAKLLRCCEMQVLMIDSTRRGLKRERCGCNGVFLVFEKKVGMVDGFDDCDLLDFAYSPKSGSKR